MMKARIRKRPASMAGGMQARGKILKEIEPNPNAQYWKQSVGQLPKSPPEIGFLEFRDEFLPFWLIVCP